MLIAFCSAKTLRGKNNSYEAFPTFLTETLTKRYAGPLMTDRTKP